MALWQPATTALFSQFTTVTSRQLLLLLPLLSCAALQCKKAERHISGMMLMDETTPQLVQQQQQQSQHVPAPWHIAMSSGVSMNGKALHSMDGAHASGNKDVD